MKRILPPKGSPEMAAELEWFSKASFNDRKLRAAKLGFATAESYCRSMVTQGGKLTPNSVPIELATPDGTSLSPDESHIIKILKKSPASIGELSRQLDRSEDSISKLIDSLGAKHYEVVLDETRHEVTIPHEPAKSFEPTEFKYFRKYYKIGCVSDTHVGSIYQQMTLLHDTYKIFDDRKTDFNIHAGDLHDGIDMYKGHREELFKYDAPQQKDYTVEHYPVSARGTKTYIIGGQHDFSFFKQNGYDIVEHVSEKRADLIYRGFFGAQFTIKDVLIELQHPGGGLSYALSYNPQKIVEAAAGFIGSIVRGDPSKYKQMPAMMILGHYHVPVLLPCYMGIDTAILPCLQSQTRWLQQHKHIPVVGCAVVEIWLDDNNNLTSTKVEFINMNSQIKEKDY